MKHHHFVLRAATIVGVLLIPAACGDAPVQPKVASKLAVVLAPSSTPKNRVVFTVPPSIQVQDSAGLAFAQSGTVVTAALTSGSGTLGGATTATTASDGKATFVNLMISGTVGQKVITFSAANLASVAATVTLIAGDAAKVALNAGNAQSAPVGAAVATAPAVKVTDADDNAVAGATVTFAVASGGGSVTGASAVSDANGIAKVTSWTLGSAVGANSITATAAGLSGSPVTFTATGTSATAGTLTKVAGDGQSANVSTTVAAAPSVKLADANGNAVAGAPVTFSVTGGGGSVTGATQTTNAQGIATVGSWMLGPATGPNTLVASASGVSPATFTATAQTGSATGGVSLSVAPTSLALTPGQSGTIQATVIRTGGFAGALTLSAEGLPANVTASFNPATLSSAQTTSTATITASASATAGTANLTIRAAGTGVAAATASVALTIATSSGGGFLALAADAGYSNACALTLAGKPYCWGDNIAGVLGNGAKGTGIHKVTPQPVGGNLTFTTITTGYHTACGLVQSGAAHCWGTNGHGSVGNGDPTEADVLSPVAVLGGLSFSSISSGERHVCAITNDQKGYCWGAGFDGNLGLGTGLPIGGEALTPMAVAGGLLFKEISAGDTHSCGVTTSGAAYCWGSNDAGELGTTPSQVDERSPKLMMSGTTFTSIGAGSGYTCGLTTAGAVYCWGRVFVQVGIAGIGVPPTNVTGGVTFVSLSVGETYACGVTQTGAGYCWGFDGNGSLGTGVTFTNRSTATAVVGGLTFARITAGSLTTCGVTTAKALYCWGGDGSGAHGDGTPILAGHTPRAVSPP